MSVLSCLSDKDGAEISQHHSICDRDRGLQIAFCANEASSHSHILLLTGAALSNRTGHFKIAVAEEQAMATVELCQVHGNTLVRNVIDSPLAAARRTFFTS
jgi:hypothetical protein